MAWYAPLVFVSGALPGGAEVVVAGRHAERLVRQRLAAGRQVAVVQTDGKARRLRRLALNLKDDRGVTIDYLRDPQRGFCLLIAAGP
jgi:hypothetical protein